MSVLEGGWSAKSGGCFVSLLYLYHVMGEHYHCISNCPIAEWPSVQMTSVSVLETREEKRVRPFQKEG